MLSKNLHAQKLVAEATAKALGVAVLPRRPWKTIIPRLVSLKRILDGHQFSVVVFHETARRQVLSASVMRMPRTL